MLRPVRLDLLLADGAEPPSHVENVRTLQSIYLERAAECTCIQPLLDANDLYGLWEYFSAVLSEMTEGPPREDTLLQIIAGKFQELGIQEDTISSLEDEIVGEAILWLHRLVPQQQEICSRIGVQQWQVLDDILAAPCARATTNRSEQKSALAAILSRLIINDSIHTGRKDNDPA